jgi:hypothetical protein
MQASATAESPPGSAGAAAPNLPATLAQRIGVRGFSGREARRHRSRSRRKADQAGFQGGVESGAGDAANFSDDAYRAAGAEIIEGAADLVGRLRHRVQGARADRKKLACCAKAAP